MTASKRTLANGFACLAIVALAFGAAADDLEFRVDTEVFKNDEKKPILEQLTIFAADGTVYDFQLTAPSETTVFDSRHGRFTLLDETKKIKAVVATQQVMDVAFGLENYAAQQKNTLVAFCAAPQFETETEEITRSGQAMVELRMVGKPLSYTVVGLKAPIPDAAKNYRYFTDWCARLNSLRGNGLPPSARLAVNKELVEAGLLPFEIVRTIPPSTPLGKKLDHKSEHRFNWTLSGEDRKRIERAGDMIATFQTVSFDEYRVADSKAAATTSKQARR
ncbi:MAG TPA: hypothetical protein VGI40_03415 [Pirellulaceae bacterium]